MRNNDAHYGEKIECKREVKEIDISLDPYMISFSIAAHLEGNHFFAFFMGYIIELPRASRVSKE
jgi:hypothetical protein